MDELIRILKDLTRFGMEKFGFYYSRYPAFVADNADPNGWCRLKVSIPEIYGDDVLDYWALPASNFAGINYGVHIVPQINDMIWVSFQKGNPRRPIWHFGYFGKNDTMAQPLKDVNNFWFKTPAGHTIEFNDTDSTIKITSKGNQIIHFGKDFISLGSVDKSKEPAVMGDTTEELLNDLFQILLEAKTMTQLGPQNFMPPTLQKITQLKTKIKNIKSTITTLN